MIANTGEPTVKKPPTLPLLNLHAGAKRTYVQATHVLVWLLLFSVVMSLPWVFEHPYAAQMYPALFYRVGVHFLLLVGLFYCNAYALIPRYLFRQHTGQYLLLVSLTTVGVQLLDLWINRQFGLTGFQEGEGMRPAGGPTPLPDREFDPFYLFSWLWALLVVGVSTSLTVTQKWLGDMDAKRELEKEQLSSELSLLKTQMNPHFFFNSLNTIYALTEVNPPYAREAVHRLSKVMRHALRETERESISLSEEIAFMRHYVELMKMRLADHVQVQCTLPEQGIEGCVPPLLFIPFIENAFRHGMSSVQQCHIRIELKPEGKGLRLRVNHPNAARSEDGGSGGKDTALAGVRRRLQLLYPGRHVLRIEEGSPEYVVDLIIEFN
jgi:hypothetical protein